jgi:DNA gyrase subunit A
MLITDIGKIIRLQISGISVISRNTQGVRLMVMEPEERLVGAARLAEQEETEEIADGAETPESDEKEDKEE